MTHRKLALALVSAVFVTACSTTSSVKDDTAGQAIAITAPVAPPPVIAEPVAPPPPPPAPVEVVEAPSIDPNLPVPGSVEDFIYQLGGDARVYFGYDQSALSDEARGKLRTQADWLKQYSNARAVIEGNADERGTREYNLALGARRANSVRSFLINQGIAANRLVSVSFGKERPISADSSESAWSRNRNSHTNLSTGSLGY